MTREDKMKLWQERLQHQKDSQLTIAARCELHQIAQCARFCACFIVPLLKKVLW
ncbi:hypothetical protein [Salinivibrio sp. ML290]|uniref:hypothetical protein n=1 Tax=Salinivibrio sp. ML290 TaxID=1909468 RepID=UPI0013011B7B|nr:hypothetical protein [Salinivibrio sp. ML290]